MSVNLWPHQRLAMDAVHRALMNDRERGLWVMPTGTGKTRAFAMLAQEMGGRTLVVVHRQELVQQALDTFGEVWPEVRAAALSEKGWEQAQVLVATVQSLVKRLHLLPPDCFRLVVLDEAHHATARTWQRVIEHCQPLLLLGCTATPTRLDGKGLCEVFGQPLFRYGLGQAMQDGYLVPLRQHGIPTEVDLSGIPSRARDFAVKDLARAVVNEARTQAVVEAHDLLAGDRPTLVFAVDLAHVQQLTEAFLGAGVPAASVTGQMKPEQRARVLEGFKAGELKVLVNCEVLTEGYDERAIGCVIMARPTQSEALYQQCVGRGLRIHPEAGKKDCLVLDVIDQCSKCRVVVASDLFGAHVEDCYGKDVREAAIEETLRWLLEPLTPTPGQSYRWGVGEDVRWEELPTLKGYSPFKSWHHKPPTDSQIKKLKGFGFEPLRELTRGEASHLIEECIRLDGLYPTPATEGQKIMLRARGLWQPGMSKRDAKRQIVRVMAVARGEHPRHRRPCPITPL
jgi:superfamily II DNA or RNA helicase